MAITLVIEDGTGLANANAYCDEAFVTAYFADRILHSKAATWRDETETEKKASAILLATQAIDLYFTFNLASLTTTQALKFPLLGQMAVPTKVKQATSELAVLALGEQLFASASSSSGAVVKEKFGDVEFTYSSDSATVTQSTDQYPQVKALLKDFITDIATGITFAYFKR